jgi:hypothetical protein
MKISTQIRQLLCTIGLAIAASACQKSTQIHTSHSVTSTSPESSAETVTVRSSEQFPIVASEPDRTTIDFEAEADESEEPDRNSIRIENRNGSHSSVRVETGQGDRRRSSISIFNSTHSSQPSLGATDSSENSQSISLGSHHLEFNYDIQTDGVNLNFFLWQDGDLDEGEAKVIAVIRTPTGETKTIDLQFDRVGKRQQIFLPGRESGTYQVTVEAEMKGGRSSNSFTFDLW